MKIDRNSSRLLTYHGNFNNLIILKNSSFFHIKLYLSFSQQKRFQGSIARALRKGAENLAKNLERKEALAARQAQEEKRKQEQQKDEEKASEKNNRETKSEEGDSNRKETTKDKESENQKSKTPLKETPKVTPSVRKPAPGDDTTADLVAEFTEDSEAPIPPTGMTSKQHTGWVGEGAASLAIKKHIAKNALKVEQIGERFKHPASDKGADFKFLSTTSFTFNSAGDPEVILDEYQGEAKTSTSGAKLTTLFRQAEKNKHSDDKNLSMESFEKINALVDQGIAVVGFNVGKIACLSTTKKTTLKEKKELDNATSQSPKYDDTLTMQLRTEDVPLIRGESFNKRNSYGEKEFASENDSGES